MDFNDKLYRRLIRGLKKAFKSFKKGFSDGINGRRRDNND